MKKTVLTFLIVTALIYSSFAQLNTSYSFTQGVGSYSPITGGVLRAYGTADDSTFSSLNIGFSFKYNGVSYTTFGLNTNGWVSMGSTAPVNTYLPISSAGTNNVIAAMGKDLQLGFSASGNYTAGSKTITSVSSIAGFVVGDILATATGFPVGTKITAIGTTSLTVSNAATTSGSAGTYTVKGEIRYGVIGAAPNRTCVIQWSRVKRFGVTATTGRNDYFNFQIRLQETSNTVKIVYGAFQTNATSSLYQVGLRGNSNSDYSNRKTTTNWSATTAGSSNTSTCSLMATVKPASGLYYSFIPVMPACNGTPTAGTLSAPTSVCSGTAFNLALSGYTNNATGITFQWQKSSTLNGTYTNISGATSANCVASQSAATYYRCNVKCNNSGMSVNSNAVLVGMNSPTNCYCTPSPSSCDDSGIGSVTFAGFNNQTGCTSSSGYTYYSNFNPTLNKGVNYPIQVSGVSSDNGNAAAWIDYNKNGVFETTEYMELPQITIDDEGYSYFANILIPTSALVGTTRMRIRTSYTTLTALSACAGFATGETEDYLITIGTAPAMCSGTPTPGTASTSLDWSGGGYTGWGLNLSLTGYPTNVSGITFQWQQSSSLNGTYVNTSGGTTPSFNTTLLSGTTYYRCKVTCSASGTSAFSNKVKVQGTDLHLRESVVIGNDPVDVNSITNGLLDKVVVYPNPSKGVFNIVTNNADIKDLQITIVDLQGKVVITSIDSNVSADFVKQLNIEGVASGLYYIKLSTSASIRIEKLIVE